MNCSGRHLVWWAPGTTHDLQGLTGLLAVSIRRQVLFRIADGTYGVCCLRPGEDEAHVLARFRTTLGDVGVHGFGVCLKGKVTPGCAGEQLARWGGRWVVVPDGGENAAVAALPPLALAGGMAADELCALQSCGLLSVGQVLALSDAFFEDGEDAIAHRLLWRAACDIRVSYC